jgi:hypothetical protein
MPERERIEPNPGDERYVRRDDEGQFTEEQDDTGRASATDQRREAQADNPGGQGDRGDRKDS